MAQVIMIYKDEDTPVYDGESATILHGGDLLVVEDMVGDMDACHDSAWIL